MKEYDILTDDAKRAWFVKYFWLRQWQTVYHCMSKSWQEFCADYGITGDDHIPYDTVSDELMRYVYKHGTEPTYDYDVDRAGKIKLIARVLY